MRTAELLSRSANAPKVQGEVCSLTAKSQEPGMAPTTGSDETKADIPVPPLSHPARTHDARHEHGRAGRAAGPAGVEYRGLPRRAAHRLPRPSVPDEGHAGQLAGLRARLAESCGRVSPASRIPTCRRGSGTRAAAYSWAPAN